MRKFLNNVRVNIATTGIGTVTCSSAYSDKSLTEVEASAVDGETYTYKLEEGNDFEIGEGVYTAAGRTLTRATVLVSKIGGVASTTKMTLGGAATLRIVSTARDFNKAPRVDEAQTFTTAEIVQARSNIGAAQLAAMASHNVVVNGAMDVSQELGTTGATLTNNTAKYILDCVEAMYNHGAATAVVTSAQLAAASFPTALAAFSFAHQIKATTAVTSPANGDFAKHRSKIEGYRIAKWGWGAAGAVSIAIAFQYYSTASGTAFVKLSNSDQSRCYYHEITVAAGWNFYAFTIAGDTSGTWQATTSAGLVFEVFSSGKETTPASSLDAWGSTNKVQTTNSTNLLGTNNNLTLLTGLYIDCSTQLPLAGHLPVLMRPFSEELKLCQRYWSYSYDGFWFYNNTGNGTVCHGLAVFQQEMRAVPTITIGSSVKGTDGKAFISNTNANTTGASVVASTITQTGYTTLNKSDSFPSGAVPYMFAVDHMADARL